MENVKRDIIPFNHNEYIDLSCFQIKVTVIRIMVVLLSLWVPRDNNWVKVYTEIYRNVMKDSGVAHN